MIISKWRKRRFMQMVVLAIVCMNLPSVFAIDLSDPSLIFPITDNKLQPSKYWTTLKKPYPTNAWFINFVLNQTNNTPSDPVNIFPYLAQISTQGISLSYANPNVYAEPTYPAIISALYYQFENQINIGTVEPMDSYGVVSYHGLRVTLQWQNAKQQRMTSPIVQGSPYLTVIFSNATPKLRSRFKLVAVNQQNTYGLIATSNRYELVFNLDKNNTQTWILYSEKPIQLNWQMEKDQSVLIATEPYTGWLRLVLQKDSQTQLNNEMAVLDSFSQTIPLDYQQHYATDAEKLTYSLLWQTQNNQPPLLLSLPHQRNITAPVPSVKYQGIKGLMAAETTLRWDIELPKVPILFLESKNPSKEQKRSLQTALTKDIDDFLAYPFPDDGPYQVGKRYARAARLLLIADKLNLHELRNKLLTRLQKLLTKQMLGKTSWHFQYDRTWGGIIPSVDDYGARNYNDHHFHYGYWVYTFAVIGKFAPDWLKNPLDDQKFSPQQWIEKLIRDFANPNDQDPYFPLQRHQDDYAGHSWASGLTSFKDGQNEQSSSEAVNAYYALALYADVINDKNLYAWAEFLMARELVAAQLYWQVQKTNPIYSDTFKANNEVIANLWGSKVDANAFFKNCATQYRCGLEYSFGIEMLPFTAISWQLLNKVWLQSAYPTLNKIINNEYGTISPAWRWLLIKGLAPILNQDEKNYFFSKVIDSKSEEYDNGDSKTNTLYFLSND